MQRYFEFIPIIAFVAVYFFTDIYFATGALILCLVVQLVVFKLKKWEISGLMLGTAVLVVVSGTLTIALRNPLFIQWKPTVVYWLFGTVIAVYAVVGKGDLIRKITGGAIEISDRAVKYVASVWAFGMVLAGILNLYVAYNYSEEVWVTFKLVSAFVIPIVLAIVTALVLFAIREPIAAETETESP